MPSESQVKLNKQSFTPLYHQIGQALRRKIEMGEWRPGHAISERELSETLGVSRMTARQALHTLRDEGLIYTERGRGTFVAEAKMPVHTRQLLGFTEDMRRRGLVPGSKVLSFRRVRPDAAMAARLGLEAGGEAFEIVRLRLADRIPMAHETCLLAAHLCPGLKRADVERGSLYQLLEQSYGVRLARADEVLEAVCVTVREAKLLSIQLRAAALAVERTVYADDDTPIEIVRSIYRGDRYQATIQLKRR
jgi:GntR family transcriptional regulator